MQSYIVDANAWIHYFEENGAFREPIENSALKTPSIVLAELSHVLSRKGVGEDKKSKAIEYVVRRSVILPLEAEQAILAGELAVKEKLHLTDAIVYSYASEEALVLTGDGDFQGKRLAHYVKP